jgi:hypothetical protein
MTPLYGGLRAPLVQWTEGADFAVAGEAWSARMGLEPQGAVLVRPDGHILTIMSRGDADDARQMPAILSAYLATPVASALTGAA